MAHIGFIKALQEHDIQIDRVAGSSAGALVGALFANGNSTEDMLSFFKEAPLFKYNYFSITKPGLIDTERYYDLLKGFLLHDSFEELTQKWSFITIQIKLFLERFITKESVNLFVISISIIKLLNVSRIKNHKRGYNAPQMIK